MGDVDDRWYRSVKNQDGELIKVPTKRCGQGKRWLARWRDEQGRQRKKSFDRKRDADQHISQVEVDLAAGTYVDPRAGNVTLQEYGEQKWLPTQVHLRTNTVAQYKTHLNNYVYPALGTRKMGSLRRSDIKAFVASISPKLAPATVKTVYAIVRALMSAAVDDGVIAINPCSKVPLPRVEARVIEPMLAASVLTLADNITQRYRIAVLLGAGAGLREGEALGITVPRVDFLRRRVFVEEQLQNRALSPLKTKASRRTVPLDDVILSEITAHMQRFAPGPDQLLITNRCRRSVDRSSFGHCWREAVTAAKLPKGTRFHDLRHFYASTLIAADLHPRAIQARLGHATITETMDTYGHLFPESEDLGRGTLDAAFRHDDDGSGEEAAQ